MTLNKKNIGATALAAITLAGGLLTAAAPAAMAQTSPEARQKDKNLMRNLGLGAAAGAVHEAVKGRTTNAVVLGAGAALAGKKYEDARRAQINDSKMRKRFRYRNGVRVGYDLIDKDGRRKASYGRVYDGTRGRWTSDYKLVRRYS
jgi:hypothetical protein